MKTVINIPDKLKKLIDNGGDLDLIDMALIMYEIRHGTPLPKGYGRLIDADALWKKWVFDAIGKQEIDEAPTIIEADKESD